MAPPFYDLCLWTGLGRCGRACLPNLLSCLFVPLGVFGFIAFKTFFSSQRDLLHLIETREESTRFGNWDVTQETEDVINPEALKVLATSSNYDIRKTAIQILSDRFLHTPAAMASLEDDLKSTNPRRCVTAVRVVRLIDRHASKKDSVEYLLPFMSWTRPNADVNINLRRSSSRRPHQRLRQETSEEQERRRRRREAIVLNEGDRPLTHEDIIQRGGGSRSSNNEETRRLEQSIAELAQENPEGHARFVGRLEFGDAIPDEAG